MSTEQLTPTMGLEANAGQGMMVNDLISTTTPPPSSAFKSEVGEIEKITPKAPLMNVKTPAKAHGKADVDNTPGSDNSPPKSTPKRKRATPAKKESAKKAKISKDDGEEGEADTPGKSGKKARGA